MVSLRPLLSSEVAALRSATLANLNWSGERFTERDLDERPALRHYVAFRPDRGDFGVVAEVAGAVVGIVWRLYRKLGFVPASGAADGTHVLAL